MTHQRPSAASTIIALVVWTAVVLVLVGWALDNL